MSAVTERNVLFDGADLVVIGIDRARDRGVVTFGPWLMNPLGAAPAEEARGFIERAFDTRGLDELHIIPRRNHWYNCAERDRALALATEFSARRKVITCGSSMGGYGAALFSALLGVRCLSISPQFSLDPEYAPFETRWLDEFAQIGHFDSEAMCGERRATGYVFYDPFTTLDAQQAKLFRGHSDLVFVPCSFSGHATVAMMNRTYGLARLASEIVEDTFTVRDFLIARRKNGRADDLYLSLLYIQACSQGHRALSDSMRRELESRKSELGLKALNSLVAFAMRRRDKSDAAIWATLAAGQDHKRPDEWLMVSKMPRRVGEITKATEAVQRGIALAPYSALLQKEL